MKIGSKTNFLTAALVAAVLIGASARADQINGTIQFGGGGMTTDTGNLATATAFTAISGVNVSGGIIAPTGSYAGTDGTTVTFTPFSFTASGVTPLWTFTVGGVTYSFDATSVGIQTQNSSFLNLQGSGMAYISGGDTTYTPTIGTWTITDTATTDQFTFSASTTTVPDSGSTALMIGLGLAGICVGGIAHRRKMVKA
jgi:hypothetical protein